MVCCYLLLGARCMPQGRDAEEMEAMAIREGFRPAKSSIPHLCGPIVAPDRWPAAQSYMCASMAAQTEGGEFVSV